MTNLDSCPGRNFSMFDSPWSTLVEELAAGGLVQLDEWSLPPPRNQVSVVRIQSLAILMEVISYYNFDGS